MNPDEEALAIVHPRRARGVVGTRHRHYFRETWGGTCRCGESGNEPECGQDHRVIEAAAVTAERERIAAAVRGLPPRSQNELIVRAAVLAIIEGREP